MPALDEKLCALYVKLNPEKPRPVTRYGTGLFLCGRRDRKSGSMVYDTETITPLTKDEARLYRKEYQTEIRDGSLLEVDRKAYLAQVKKREKAARKLAEQTSTVKEQAADDAEKGA